MILGRRDGAARDPSTVLRDRRFAVAFFALLLLLLGALYAGAYYFTSDRLPRNAEVAGVEIGGLAPAEAEQTLNDELKPRAARPMTLTVDEGKGKQREFDPQAAGLSFDAEATVDQAGGGRSLNPWRMLQVLTGGEDVEPVVNVDRAALDRALARVAKDIDQKPVQGNITFDGAKPDPSYPRPGITVDTEAAGERVQAALLSEDRTVALPADTVSPDVTSEQIDKAVRDFARPVVSGPVTVKVPNDEIELGPQVFAPALSMQVVDGSLEPRIDAKLLRKRVAKPFNALTKPARDATVELRDGQPTVVPSRSGTRVEVQQFQDELLSVVTAEGNDRVVEMDTKVAKPAFTTKQARGLGIKEVVSSFTTYFPHSDYRNTNLGEAAERISGTVLKPDDIFSLNGIVGERTAENGFTEGSIISDGVLVEDFGGGVSQVATTTYNAAFFAGLKDIEHRPHSFYIDRYPMGREATVVWGALDLKFQNNTPHGVLVEAWIVPSTPGSQGEMHVRMWSTQYWERIEAGRSEQHNFTEPQVRYNQKDNCEPMSGSRGFDVDVFRYFIRDGERVDTEEWNVRYNPAPIVRCSAPPNNDNNGGGGGGG